MEELPQCCCLWQVGQETDLPTIAAHSRSPSLPAAAGGAADTALDAKKVRKKQLPEVRVATGKRREGCQKTAHL